MQLFYLGLYLTLTLKPIPFSAVWNMPVILLVKHVILNLIGRQMVAPVSARKATQILWDVRAVFTLDKAPKVKKVGAEVEAVVEVAVAVAVVAVAVAAVIKVDQRKWRLLILLALENQGLKNLDQENPKTIVDLVGLEVAKLKN